MSLFLNAPYAENDETKAAEEIIPFFLEFLNSFSGSF